MLSFKIGSSSASYRGSSSAEEESAVGTVVPLWNLTPEEQDVRIRWNLDVGNESIDEGWNVTAWRLPEPPRSGMELSREEPLPPAPQTSLFR